MLYLLSCSRCVLLTLFFATNPLLEKITSLTKDDTCNTASACQISKEDAIIGKWVTVEKSVAVEVYKKNGNYHAKVIWFKIEDTTRPMNTRTDEKNPDPALRNRKWLGMEVLRGLKYNARDDEWQDGIIYDAKHGREWDSIAWINKKGLLKVKGYWVFKFISETLTFERLQA